MVKVMARISSGFPTTPRSLMYRLTSKSVFPEPAGACTMKELFGSSARLRLSWSAIMATGRNSHENGPRRHHAGIRGRPGRRPRLAAGGRAPVEARAARLLPRRALPDLPPLAGRARAPGAALHRARRERDRALVRHARARRAREAGMAPGRAARRLRRESR